jgi:hypothetical protein
LIVSGAFAFDSEFRIGLAVEVVEDEEEDDGEEDDVEWRLVEEVANKIGLVVEEPMGEDDDGRIGSFVWEWPMGMMDDDGLMEEEDEEEDVKEEEDDWKEWARMDSVKRNWRG